MTKQRGFAVVYRWWVKPGLEEQFQTAWHQATLAIQHRCGSFGSRLHASDDGTFLGYARWPDAAARQRCFEDGAPDELAAEAMMAAIQRVEEFRLDILDDLLAEPS